MVAVRNDDGLVMCFKRKIDAIEGAVDWFQGSRPLKPINRALF